MNLFNLMGKPGLPNIVAFQPAGLLGFPNSVEVTDRWSNTGSGVGGGANSIRTALGEYFERRHFYKEIVSKDCALLSEFLREDEVDCFVKVFLQTSSRKISSSGVKNIGLKCLKWFAFLISQPVIFQLFSYPYLGVGWKKIVQSIRFGILVVVVFTGIRRWPFLGRSKNIWKGSFY